MNNPPQQRGGLPSYLIYYFLDLTHKVIHNLDLLGLSAIHLLNLPHQNSVYKAVQHSLVQFLNCGIPADFLNSVMFISRRALFPVIYTPPTFY